METKDRTYPHGDYPPLKYSKTVNPTEITGRESYYSRERWQDRRDYWMAEQAQAERREDVEYAQMCRRMAKIYRDRLSQAMR